MVGFTWGARAIRLSAWAGDPHRARPAHDGTRKGNATDLSGGLVEDVLVGFEFFDEEELAFVFDDSGDGDVGLPGHW